MTVHAEDVALLDRIAELDGSSRSALMRQMLVAARPNLRQVVAVYDALEQSRADLHETAAQAALSDLQAVAADVEALHQRTLGVVTRLEQAAVDPRRSNHGGQNLATPTTNRLDVTESDTGR